MIVAGHTTHVPNMYMYMSSIRIWNVHNYTLLHVQYTNTCIYMWCVYMYMWCVDMYMWCIYNLHVVCIHVHVYSWNESSRHIDLPS